LLVPPACLALAPPRRQAGRAPQARPGQGLQARGPCQAWQARPVQLRPDASRGWPP